ncbi:J517_1871 family lipoprotein [Halomonas sp.]|uniref:J517_1871 family lipoprotein n=1 Tax=Halomonas sp. TaxID=1486246 RepID=UPI003A0FEC22
MIKILTSLLLASVLAGCALYSNDYAQVEPVPLDIPIEGIWSGGTLGSTTTYVFYQDGNGYACTDFGGDANIARVKYLGNNKVMGSGGHTQSISVDDGVMTIRYLGVSTDLIPDPDLDEAAVLCLEPLKSVM